MTDYGMFSTKAIFYIICSITDIPPLALNILDMGNEVPIMRTGC